MTDGDLSASKTIDEDEAVMIFKQICQGIEYLHDNGIIHRDLKPHNIFRTNSNGIMTLKIGDLGFAKILGEGETTNNLFGTIYFIAPEIIQMKNYNHKVDVWSIGIILYFLLFEKIPFDSANDDKAEVASKICNKQFSLSDWRYISDPVKELIKYCLEKNPNSRYNIKQVVNHRWLR
jgi:serine/threonine protein kinase